MREILELNDEVYVQRFGRIKDLRDTEVDILRKFGHRRPHWVFYVGLTILPVYAALAPYFWLLEKENPLDRNTIRHLNQQINIDGKDEEVRLSSSSGSVTRSDRMDIEVRGSSKLVIIQPHGILVEATISRYDPHHRLLLQRPATIEEIDLHRELLVQVRSPLEAARSTLRTPVHQLG